MVNIGPMHHFNEIALTGLWCVLQFELPLDHRDAAVSLMKKGQDGRLRTKQGSFHEIRLPNCQGVWPEDLGEVEEGR